MALHNGQCSSQTKAKSLANLSLGEITAFIYEHEALCKDRSVSQMCSKLAISLHFLGHQLPPNGRKKTYL